MDYRLYQLGGGRLLMAGDLRCRSDDEATHVAEKLRCGRAMELWHGSRLVAAWTDPHDRPGGAAGGVAGDRRPPAEGAM